MRRIALEEQYDIINALFRNDGILPTVAYSMLEAEVSTYYFEDSRNVVLRNAYQGGYQPPSTPLSQIDHKNPWNKYGPRLFDFARLCDGSLRPGELITVGDFTGYVVVPTTQECDELIGDMVFDWIVKLRRDNNVSL